MAVLDDVRQALHDRIVLLEREIDALNNVADAAMIAADALNGNGQKAWTDPKAHQTLSAFASGDIGGKAALGKSKRSKAKRGRPAATGKTMDRVADLVSNYENIGITTTDIASFLKMKPNYLYRALPKLEQAGKVRRDDSKPPRWYPTG